MQLDQPCTYFFPEEGVPELWVHQDDRTVIPIPVLYHSRQRIYFRQRVVQLVSMIVQLPERRMAAIFAPFISLFRPELIYPLTQTRRSDSIGVPHQQMDRYDHDIADWRAEFSVTLAIESLDDALDRLRVRPLCTNKRKTDSSCFLHSSQAGRCSY